MTKAEMVDTMMSIANNTNKEVRRRAIARAKDAVQEGYDFTIRNKAENDAKFCLSLLTGFLIY